MGYLSYSPTPPSLPPRLHLHLHPLLRSTSNLKPPLSGFIRAHLTWSSSSSSLSLSLSFHNTNILFPREPNRRNEQLFCFHWPHHSFAPFALWPLQVLVITEMALKAAGPLSVAPTKSTSIFLFTQILRILLLNPSPWIVRAFVKALLVLSVPPPEPPRTMLEVCDFHFVKGLRYCVILPLYFGCSSVYDFFTAEMAIEEVWMLSSCQDRTFRYWKFEFSLSFNGFIFLWNRILLPYFLLVAVRISLLYPSSLPYKCRSLETF